jgi:hypothetical protein
VDPTQDTSKAEKRPAAPTPGALADPAGTIEGELIGVTFWRLRSATVEDKQDRKRLLLQQVSDQNSSFLPERVSADMRFKEGSLVRPLISLSRSLSTIQQRSYSLSDAGLPFFENSRTRVFPAPLALIFETEKKRGRSAGLPLSPPLFFGLSLIRMTNKTFNYSLYL